MKKYIISFDCDFSCYYAFSFWLLGDDCEREVDGCAQDPCPHGRNCTDLSPEQEELFHRGYNCSACPHGFRDVDEKCEGTYLKP